MGAPSARSEAQPAALAPVITLVTNDAALPRPQAPLVGRVAELAALHDLLEDDRVRLMTLAGPGGVGKTRLAIQLAHETMPGYPDGVAFVSLAALTAPELVLPTVAQTLGLREADDRSPRHRLHQFLQPKRLLLVLDNVEWVTAAGADIAELLAECPGLTIVATSRVPLRIDGEREFLVPPLSLPDRPIGGAPPPAVAALAASEAVTLFMERARDVRPGFALTERNAPVIAEICRHLDGLPLAIELAAAWIRLLSPAAILSRLDNRLRLLVGGDTVTPDRLRTMRATIAWSHDLLSPAERICFRRLAVFVGGFTADAAEAVCREDEPDPIEPPLLHQLAGLVNHNLLRLENRPDGETRFTMLETIREYAHERLVESGEEAPIRQRHLEHVLALVESPEAQLLGDAESAWLDRLEAEHDNFRAALTWAEDCGDADLGLRLAAALGDFWDARGHLTEGRGWLDRMLAGGGNAPPVTRARALTAAGQLADGQGDNEQAQAYFANALAFWQAIGDPGGKGRALHGLGLQARKRGDYAEAAALHEEELTLYRESGDRRGIAYALNGLGTIAYFQGTFGEAERLFEESLALCRVIDDDRRRSFVLNNLGMVAFRRGDYGLAAARHEENVALTQALGDRQGLAMALGNLAIAVHMQGDIPRAVELSVQVLDLFRRLGDQWGIGHALNNLGLAVRAQGDDARARALFAESLPLRRLLGDKRGIAVTLLNLGGSVRLAGELGRAEALLTECLSVFEELGEPNGINATRVQLGLVACDQGNRERARELVRLGLKHLLAIGDTAGAADALEGVAEIAAQAGAVSQAVRLLGAGHRQRELGDVPSFPAERARYDRLITRVREALSEPAFAAAWEAGRTSSPARIVDAAAGVVADEIEADIDLSHGLSRRQLDVLRLIAQGKSDREIAENLSVSPRTVGGHVTNILATLEVSSRAAAAAYAVRHGIA